MEQEKITWVKQSSAYWERKLKEARSKIEALLLRLKKHQTDLSAKNFSTLDELFERVSRRRAVLHAKVRRLQDKYAQLIVRVRKLLSAVSRGRLMYQSRLLKLRVEHHAVVEERSKLLAQMRRLEDELRAEISRVSSLQTEKAALSGENFQLRQETASLKTRAANAEQLARAEEAARRVAERECQGLRNKTKRLGWVCGVAIPSALGLAVFVLTHLR